MQSARSHLHWRVRRSGIRSSRAHFVVIERPWLAARDAGRADRPERRVGAVGADGVGEAARIAITSPLTDGPRARSRAPTRLEAVQLVQAVRQQPPQLLATAGGIHVAPHQRRIPFAQLLQPPTRGSGRGRPAPPPRASSSAAPDRGRPVLADHGAQQPPSAVVIHRRQLAGGPGHVRECPSGHSEEHHFDGRGPDDAADTVGSHGWPEPERYGFTISSARIMPIGIAAARTPRDSKRRSRSAVGATAGRIHRAGTILNAGHWRRARATIRSCSRLSIAALSSLGIARGYLGLPQRRASSPLTTARMR